MSETHDQGMEKLRDEIVATVIARAADELVQALRERQQDVVVQPTSAPQLDNAKRTVGSAVRAWLKDVKGVADANERSMLDELGWRGKRTIDVPMNLTGGLFRAAEVGDAVPLRIGEVVAEKLSGYAAVRRVANLISTDTLERLTLPVFDDRANTAALLPSGGIDMTESVDPTLSSITLDCYTMHSKPIVVQTALLRDAAFDLEAMIGDTIAWRIGRAANNYWTVGTGSSQPTGLLAASGGVPVGVTTASTSAITWQEILDLLYYVDEGERQNAVWMMHPQIRAYVEKLTDNQGRPLFWPDLTGNSPGRLLGYPVVENMDMPSAIQASAKVIIFGNFKRYAAREVNRLRLAVLQERFVEFDAVGFLAFYSFDGKLQAASTTKAIGVLRIKSS